ncbi:DUF6864 domain-containing function [Azotobacter chroococcum]|uniref:DUF6864 domain-containing function n=1 Tax=Azotobacter chroococcum TaxID=353 RepID=UPI0011858E19|nr:hypothetical protein [Azotobacter chroococcum]
MKIKAGDLEVYSSGAINSDKLTPTRFTILESPKFEVICKVVFDGGASSLNYNVTGEGELTFTFMNPEALGFGLANPLKIGFLEGKEVYVIFRISMHGENQSYTLDYTFYLKEVSNG